MFQRRTYARRASPVRGWGSIPRPWGRSGDARPIVRAAWAFAVFLGASTAYAAPFDDLEKACLSEHKTVSDIAGSLTSDGWQHVTLETLPAFNQMWGDFSIIKSLFLDGPPQIADQEQRHKFYNQARYDIMQRDSQALLALRLIEPSQSEKRAQFYLYEPKSQSWAIVSKPRKNVECELLTRSAEKPPQSWGLDVEDQPFGDYAELSSSSEKRIELVTIVPEGFAYLTGESPILAQVAHIERQDED